MADNIQNALSEFSHKIENNKIAPTSTDTVVSNGKIVEKEEEDLFDGAVIAGIDASDIASAEDIQEADPEVSMEEMWRKHLREKMADMATKDPALFKSESDKIIRDLINSRKEMMIKGGLTAEEADRAVENRLNRRGTEANTNFIKENPNLAIVTIDKRQADQIEFTDEEKSKLVKTKAIRLVEVEDRELSTIKIKEDVKQDALYHAIHRVSCNISNYSMPMLNVYDVCKFSGATTTQLVQAIYNENDNLYRKYQEQLELVYAKFTGSTTKDKYDVEGNIIFTKDDFANWFKFHDLPVAMYAIYVASSTEEITSQFECTPGDGGCDHEGGFKFTYNCKGLIKYKDISDEYQKDLDTILKTENDRDAMLKLQEDRRPVKRFKSPYTNNIYDVVAPSVARALSILRHVPPRDTYAQYIALYAMMFSAIYVYDPSDGQYFKIEATDSTGIMRFMYDITDTELKLIARVVGEHSYVPTFELDTKCPHCGKERTTEFSIDQLVFLKAQSIGEEIE